MESIDQRSAYYTYQEASQLLNISYSHLLKCIMYGAFRPHRPFKGSRKYLLKSEVNAKVGKILYSLRKPKSLKKNETPDIDTNSVAPVNINDMPASEALKIIENAIQFQLDEFEAQIAARIDGGENLTKEDIKSELKKVSPKIMHDSAGLYALLNEYKITTGEHVELTQEEEEEINQSGDKCFICTDDMTFLEYKEAIRKYGLQVDEGIDNT